MEKNMYLFFKFQWKMYFIGGAIMPFSKKVVCLLIEKHWYEKY